MTRKTEFALTISITAVLLLAGFLMRNAILRSQDEAAMTLRAFVVGVGVVHLHAVVWLTAAMVFSGAHLLVARVAGFRPNV